MRVFSYILAFYMLFLAVEPGFCALISPSQEVTDCCSSSCKPGETEVPEEDMQKEEDNENKVCNPFQFCKCCLGFNADFAAQGMSPLKPSSKLSVTTREEVPPQISLDFWQPPKLV